MGAGALAPRPSLPQIRRRPDEPSSPMRPKRPAVDPPPPALPHLPPSPPHPLAPNKGRPLPPLVLQPRDGLPNDRRRREARGGGALKARSPGSRLHRRRLWRPAFCSAPQRCIAPSSRNLGGADQTPSPQHNETTQHKPKQSKDEQRIKQAKTTQPNKTLQRNTKKPMQARVWAVLPLHPQARPGLAAAGAGGTRPAKNGGGAGFDLALTWL